MIDERAREVLGRLILTLQFQGVLNDFNVAAILADDADTVVDAIAGPLDRSRSRRVIWNQP